MKRTALGLSLIPVIACLTLSVFAQEKVRRVEQPTKYTYSDTPVEVTVLLDGKEMAGREAFTGPDWLRRMSLQVKNISGKTIKWVWINLVIREGSPSPRKTGIVLTYERGTRPAETEILKSGESWTLTLPESNVKFWTDYAQKQGIEEITKVILDVRSVAFSDDTGWERGRPTRRSR